LSDAHEDARRITVRRLDWGRLWRLFARSGEEIFKGAAQDLPGAHYLEARRTGGRAAGGGPLFVRWRLPREGNGLRAEILGLVAVPLLALAVLLLFLLVLLALVVVVDARLRVAPLLGASFGSCFHQGHRSESEALLQEAGDDELGGIAAQHAPSQAEILGAHGAVELIGQA